MIWEKYYIVRFRYWFGCSAIGGHDFIQVFEEKFDSEEEAQKRLNELKEKYKEEFEDAIVMVGYEVIEHIKKDIEYEKRCGEGNWGFPNKSFFEMDDEIHEGYGDIFKLLYEIAYEEYVEDNIV